MYVPFLRSKKEEITALNKLAPLINYTRVLPIIEPVNSNNLSTLIANNIRFILIVNPSVPNRRPNRPLTLTEVTNNIIAPIRNSPNLIIGYVLTAGTIQEIQQIGLQFNDCQIAFIHNNEFANPIGLNQAINGLGNVAYNIFRTDNVSNLYTRSYNQIPKISIEDYFTKQITNVSYPLTDFFTDKHLSYRNEGFDGMGGKNA